MFRSAWLLLGVNFFIAIVTARTWSNTILHRIGIIGRGVSRYSEENRRSYERYIELIVIGTNAYIWWRQRSTWSRKSTYKCWLQVSYPHGCVQYAHATSVTTATRANATSIATRNRANATSGQGRKSKTETEPTNASRLERLFRSIFLYQSVAILHCHTSPTIKISVIFAFEQGTYKSNEITRNYLMIHINIKHSPYISFEENKGADCTTITIMMSFNKTTSGFFYLDK